MPATEAGPQDRPGAATAAQERSHQDGGITSLAQYYTSDIKYAPHVFERDSAALEALLRERGFLG